MPAGKPTTGASSKRQYRLFRAVAKGQAREAKGLSRAEAKRKADATKDPGSLPETAD